MTVLVPGHAQSIARTQFNPFAAMMASGETAPGDAAAREKSTPRTGVRGVAPHRQGASRGALALPSWFS